MSFYSTYELMELVKDDGIKSFRAREIATGRDVLVHLFSNPDSLETQFSIQKIRNLTPEARALVIVEGQHEGTPYVVTSGLPGNVGFRDWLVSQRTASAKDPQQTPPAPAAINQQRPSA